MSVSDRLKNMIEAYFERSKKSASARLCVAAGCGQRTIYRIKNEGHVPNASTAYRLAKACGWSEKESMDLCQEILAIEVAETA